MSEIIEIKIKVGINNLKFGATPSETEKTLGKPDENEHIKTDDENEADLWLYHDQAVSLFFEKVTNYRFSCIETDNDEAILFGKEVFKLSEKELIDLMNSKGFTDCEVDEEAWGEKRVSFHDGLIDFYYENDEMISISWAGDINENGDVILPK